LAARSLGSEWFLPSKKALNVMCLNKATLEAASGFDAFSNFYWSSSEYDFRKAWGQNFFMGNQFDTYKQYPLNVRAVRVF
jgi:hypothetical protein